MSSTGPSGIQRCDGAAARRSGTTPPAPQVITRAFGGSTRPSVARVEARIAGISSSSRSVIGPVTLRLAADKSANTS